MSHINFDANAGQQLLPSIQAEVTRFLGSSYNPSAVHQLGQGSKSVLEEARGHILCLLHAENDYRVVFTSGATEANNLALANFVAAKQHIVSSGFEHPSVNSILEKAGANVSSVQYSGAEFEHRILSAIRPDTKAVSIMFANNEVGYILPVGELFKRIGAIRPDIFLHTDLVQGVGRVDLQLGAELPCHAATISAHKIGGLTGVGALILRKDMAAHLKAHMIGGAQEGGIRAGTENVVGIHSFGLAAKELALNLKRYIKNMLEYRAEFLGSLAATNKGAYREISNNTGLPNTISLHIPGVRADDFVVACDLKGLAISSGAACNSGKPSPSHVLLSLGMTPEEARETVRISFLGAYDKKEFVKGIDIFISCLQRFLQ